MVDVPTIEMALSPPDHWVLELLRCSDCARSDLGQPTAGYEEALVDVAISDSGAGHTVDATDLRLIDYSPASEGAPVPPLPAQTIAIAMKHQDLGLSRLSRLQEMVTSFRRTGDDDVADEYELCIESALMDSP